MNSEEFENSILDYLDGVLPNDKRVEFEKALAEDKELLTLFSEYKAMLKIESAIQRETYPATPKFALSVMDQIRGQRRSIFSYLFDIFKVHPGLVTAMTLLMVLTLTIYNPNSPPVPSEIAHHAEVPQIKGQQNQIASVEPFNMQVFDNYSGQSAFDDQQNLQKAASSLDELLNSMSIPFPIGKDRPIAISSEIVRSPRDKNEVVIRITLTAEQQDVDPIKDVTLALEFNPDLVVQVQPVANAVLAKPVALKKSVWVRGSQLLKHQQFTTIIFAQLKPALTASGTIINGTVTLNQKGRAISQPPFLIGLQNILPSVDKASIGLRQAFTFLFQGYKLAPLSQNPIGQFRDKLGASN